MERTRKIIRRSTTVIAKRSSVQKAIKSRIVRDSFITTGKVSFDIEHSPTTQKQWATIHKFSKFY